VADIDEISALLGGYGRWLDHGGGDAAAVFADRLVWTFPWLLGPASLEGTRAEVGAWWQAFYRDAHRQVAHVFEEPTVQVEGDRGRVEAGFRAEHELGASVAHDNLAARWAVTGRLEASAARTALGWRFERMTITVDDHEGAAAATTACAAADARLPRSTRRHV
jgi:hypothetical protein